MTRGVPFISTLNRVLLRELFSSRGVLTAIALITAVGVMSYVSMLTAYRNLEQSRAAYYARCRMADFSVDLKKAPLVEVEALRDVPGVADLRSRIQFSALVDVPEVAKPLGGLVISLPDRRQPVIDDIVIRQGGYFTDQRSEEVIVSEDFARARRLTVGDLLRLTVNNRRIELLIVGTAISSEFVYLLPPGGLVPQPAEYGVFWIKRRYAEEVFDFQGACNQIVGILDPALRQHPEVVLQQIEQRLDTFGVFGTVKLADQASNMILTNEMRGLRTTAHFLPVMFLAVAALALNALITSNAERQRTVIGTLKALGYTNATVFAHFVKYALVVGLAGSLLGCAIGYWLAGGLTEIYRAEFFKFPELVNQVYPDVMLVGIAISVACAVLGALRGARRMVRLNPAESMRPKPPRAGHRLALERFAGLWQRLGTTWQSVLRNVVRERGRSLSGVFASLIGAALMLISFYQSDAMDFLVRFQFERLLTSDYTLVFGDDRDRGALHEARRLPGVDYAEAAFNVACTLRQGSRHRKVVVEGIEPDSVLTIPSNRTGAVVPVPRSGLLLTRRMAALLQVDTGDQVQLVPVKGLKQPRTVRVAGIIDSYVGLGIYADYHWLNRLVGEADAVNAVQLRTSQSLADRLALYRAVKRMPAVQGIHSARETKENLEAQVLGSMRVMSAVIIGFAGLIYFGSILNASLISLKERQREVATYRVLGYSPGEVGNMFLRESLLVNLPGALIGLPVGYWLSTAYAASFDTDTFRFPLIINPRSFIWAFLLALMFTLAAHLLVRRSINRLNWLEALNLKE